MTGFALPSREAVDERYAELTAAGYKGLQPRSTLSGAHATQSSDPNGIDVGLMSPIDRERKFMPKEFMGG